MKLVHLVNLFYRLILWRVLGGDEQVFTLDEALLYRAFYPVSDAFLRLVLLGSVQ